MRTYEHADYLRLFGIFVAAGSVLAGSLVVVALASAGVAHQNTYFWATIATAALLSPNVYPLIPASVGLVRDPEASTRAWVFSIILGSFVICSGLLILNLLHWRAAWPLIATFSIQISYGLFLFARMLTVRK